MNNLEKYLSFLNKLACQGDIFRPIGLDAIQVDTSEISKETIMALVKVDYEKYEDRIPPHTLETLRNYIEYGVPTGGFLHSVLTDSLFGAYGKADPGNRETLGDIVMFIYNEAPGGCWGSSDHVKAWRRKKGRQGRDA